MNMNTQQIPVDAQLQLQTNSSSDFFTCHALAVSQHSVHVLLDQPLNNQATVTIMVRPEGTGQQPYYVSGEVKKRGLQDGGWLHEVIASSNRPWSPMFQYDVLCSTIDVHSNQETPLPDDIELSWAELTRKRQLNQLNQIAA